MECNSRKNEELPCKVLVFCVALDVSLEKDIYVLTRIWRMGNLLLSMSG